ncbi:MAG: hypothetical protein B7Z75_02925 [Acidocella sp. 20-57-95]|nr:MAG: hypothetical protein B7Z75_02925 [Acidocella sp. 20-57-95]OYV58356.1 MAG: hypothetical protein B7Z71_10480 [Acidocella sp. 21-58-7]HQT64502.1 hypothetical protein [Acidocella sp.]HQU04853.1 hypothetical protein [Acidocella sp.]
MNLKILASGLILGVAVPVSAMARQDPLPPPSGVVVHLFGPDSIMSNVIPTTPQAGLAGNTGANTASSTGNAGNLSLGDIAHQMFVTGDPNDPSRPATGKTGQFNAR